MKKTNKISLVLSSLLLAATLAGCSNGGSGDDGVARSYKDGKEADVEKAAIKLVKAVDNGKYNLISAEELKKGIDAKDDMVIVDTMPAKHFEKSHIQGAVNAELPVKMDEVTPEQKEAFLKVLGDNKDKKVVIYCGFVGCERSHVGALIAKEAGYNNVYRFPGGIAAWVDAGNSVSQ